MRVRDTDGLLIPAVPRIFSQGKQGVKCHFFNP
jgi:hypothetical protein